MTTTEAKQLIENGVETSASESSWADLGCGNGIFTKALEKLLVKGSAIYAIDQTQIEDLPQSDKVQIHFYKMNFETNAFPFSKIDGILLANSLHYVKDKSSVLQKIKSHLRTSGRLIIIEYDTSNSNAWVPYPIPFKNLKELLSENGFTKIQKIGERPSIYRREKMYACLIKM